MSNDDARATIAVVTRAIAAISAAMDACQEKGAPQPLRQALFEAAATAIKVKGKLGEIAGANNKRLVA